MRGSRHHARDHGSRAAPRSRWLGRCAWAFLICVYLVVAAAWLWDYDLTRGGSTYAALALGAFLVRVLGVHAAIPGAAILLLALALRRRRYALACVPVLLFLTWPVLDGFEGGHRTEPRSGDITLMSANLRYDAYEQGHEDLLRQIEECEPDIVLLQEYSRSWFDTVHNDLLDKYPHTIEHPRSRPRSTMLYSRVPLVDSGDGSRVRLGEWNALNVRAVVEIDGERLVLYGVHLPMPLSRVAHTEQRRQIRDLLARAQREDGPVLIVGDYNFTETTSHHAAFLDAGLRSAWDELRRGRGETWRRPGRFNALPGLRLDHVMVNDGVELARIDRGDRSGSDHWPLVAEFSLRDVN